MPYVFYNKEEPPYHQLFGHLSPSHLELLSSPWYTLTLYQ